MTTVSPPRRKAQTMNPRNLRIPLLILAFATVLAVSGCGAAKPTGPVKGGDVNGSWVLASIGGFKGEVGALKISATFERGTVNGFSGVNTYRGPAGAKADGSFHAGPLASTMMAGPPEAMAAEQAYLKALEAATTFGAGSGKLTLYAPDGSASLVYSKAATPKLEGTSWLVTGYNNGKEAVVSVAVDSTITTEFSQDGRVSGSGGVNTYGAEFAVSGESIQIGPVASTKKAGPENLMTQETLYLAALQKATLWAVSGDKLELRDASGALQVTAMRATAK